MDQIKEKLNCEYIQATTHIENFSNEIFYELFDYLDNYGIYMAFSNLNNRFQQLLNSSSLLFKIEHTYLTHNKITNNYKQFLILNKHKIFSIKLSLELDNNNFFLSFIINSSLICLQSLFVDDILPEMLISLLTDLADLPRLVSLRITASNTSKKSNEIYRLIFALPKLKSNKLTLDENDSSITLPMASIQHSTIEYLSIDHFCTFKELFILFSYTPELRHLKFLLMNELDRSIQTMLPITLSNLTYISIEIFDAKFDCFEIFVRKIYSKLKFLHIIISSHDIDFFNASRWEQLILQSFTELENFCLRYYEITDSQSQFPIYYGGQNQFISSFWIERQWIFQVKIDGKSIHYSVHPYRKRWYEYAQEKIFNSVFDFTKSIQLIVTNTICYEVLGLCVIRVLTVTQVHHLEIPDKIFIDSLLALINLLPELESLKIHSFSLLKPKNADKSRINSSINSTNKITKLYLKKIGAVEEFFSFLNLFPSLIYFKVQYMNHMDIESLLRQIVVKINHDLNSNLHLLCVHVPTADDTMINKLDKMISDEKLLLNYIISRVLQNIYLAWK